MSQLTLEAVREAVETLKRKVRFPYLVVVHPDDVLSVLRALRKDGYRTRRGQALTGKKNATFVAARGLEEITIAVNIHRNMPSGKILFVPKRIDFQ